MKARGLRGLINSYLLINLAGEKTCHVGKNGVKRTGTDLSIHPAGRSPKRLPETGNTTSKSDLPRRPRERQVRRQRQAQREGHYAVSTPGPLSARESTGQRVTAQAGTIWEAEATWAEALEWLGAGTRDRGVLVTVPLSCRRTWSPYLHVLLFPWHSKLSKRHSAVLHSSSHWLLM